MKGKTKNRKNRKQYKLIATVFDKHGRILSIATNSYQKTHPYQAKLAKKVGEPHKVFLHAEIRAILKAQKFGSPHKIKIERYDACGNPVNAEPCKICKLAIKEVGIKLIEYTV